jgi:hypothetical protein
MIFNPARPLGLRAQNKTAAKYKVARVAGPPLQLTVRLFRTLAHVMLGITGPMRGAPMRKPYIPYIMFFWHSISAKPSRSRPTIRQEAGHNRLC